MCTIGASERALTRETGLFRARKEEVDSRLITMRI
jgi:hypothetical protein